MTDLPLEPLSKDILAEQWYSLLQNVLSALQTAFRTSGYTKEALARRIGKDPAAVNRCLKGLQNMTLRTMHELARGMNCRLKIELEPLENLTRRNHRNSPLQPREIDEHQSIITTPSPSNGQWKTSSIPAHI